MSLVPPYLPHLAQVTPQRGLPSHPIGSLSRFIKQRGSEILLLRRLPRASPRREPRRANGPQLVRPLPRQRTRAVSRFMPV